MLRILFLCVLFSFSVRAEILPADLETLAAFDDKILNVTIEADIGMGVDNPRWTPSQTDIKIILEKLETLKKTSHPYDSLFEEFPDPDPTYKGLILRFKTVEGDIFDTIRIYNSVVSSQDGIYLAPDAGRQLEYWLFGTNTEANGKLLAAQLLPFFDYDQCVLVGNITVETTPKQCLLPDNRILLDVPHKPTEESAKAIDFETCLEHGEALIATFPRRCLAAGGRVFTEEPKLPAIEQYELEMQLPEGLF